MSRARRLRRSAPVTPGTDARHRRQPAAPRRHSARRAAPHTPPAQPVPEVPDMPVLGPTSRQPACTTPPPEPELTPEPDSTARGRRA